jgi:hypothetical protein
MARETAFKIRVKPHLYEGWGPDGKLSLRRITSATADRIGRVLLSHLMLEHYLDRNLTAIAPRDFDFARPSLSFAQKVDILSGPESYLVATGLVPGIRRVNKIRNSLAHDLRAEISAADVQPLVDYLRHAGRGRGLAIPKDPIVVVETFSALAIAGMVGFASAVDAAGNPSVVEAIKHRTAANKALNATGGRGRPPAR